MCKLMEVKVDEVNGFESYYRAYVVFMNFNLDPSM